MRRTEVQLRWEAFRERAEREAVAAKNAQAVVFELSRQYAALDGSERSEVDLLLADWIESDDEAKRFDALALVEMHEIASAAPALRALAARLEASTTPGAPYEWAKVNRVLGFLASDGEELPEVDPT